MYKTLKETCLPKVLDLSSCQQGSYRNVKKMTNLTYSTCQPNNCYCTASMQLNTIFRGSILRLYQYKNHNLGQVFAR